MYAVVKTGGKQYRVAANDLLKVEKLSGAPGDVVELGEVLLLAGDGGIEVGNPLIAGASVAAEIVGHVRGDRIIIFKKRRRHHYRRRNGHRQDLTQIRITEILTAGARPSQKAAAPLEATPAPTPVEAAEPVMEEKVQTATAAKAKSPEPKAKATATKSKAAAKPKATTRAKTAKKPPAKKK